jgi:hypothetical protein
MAQSVHKLACLLASRCFAWRFYLFQVGARYPGRMPLQPDGCPSSGTDAPPAGRMPLQWDGCPSSRTDAPPAGRMPLQWDGCPSSGTDAPPAGRMPLQPDGCPSSRTDAPPVGQGSERAWHIGGPLSIPRPYLFAWAGGAGPEATPPNFSSPKSFCCFPTTPNSGTVLASFHAHPLTFCAAHETA